MGHDQAHQAAAGAVLASYVEEGETRFHCFFVSFAKQQLRWDTKSGRVNVGILAVEAVLLLQAFDDFNRVVMPTERNIKIRLYITKVCTIQMSKADNILIHSMSHFICGK